MTLINYFSNLNMGNFMSGWNSWSLPTFSCSFMPSFFDFNSFMPMFSDWSFPRFNNWSMPSLFNFTPTNDFSMNFNNNNIWDNSNFTMPSFSSPWNSTIGDSFTLTNKNKTKFSLSNYNASAGERLARYALQHAKSKSTSYCASYVKQAIANVGLGTYQNGHAYQMTNILRNNSHFKEISPSSVNVKDLPAGCVIVFNKGTYNYSDKYGHVEITTGDGRAVSDFVNKNLKKPSAIFVPV